MSDIWLPIDNKFVLEIDIIIAQYHANLNKLLVDKNRITDELAYLRRVEQNLKDAAEYSKKSLISSLKGIVLLKHDTKTVKREIKDRDYLLSQIIKAEQQIKDALEILEKKKQSVRFKLLAFKK